MDAKSLLVRAGEARSARVAAGSELEGDFAFEESSGISKEDQKEILLHIDKVARSSRILPGPETWKVRPRKRGLLLPLAVNLAAAGALALGLLLVWGLSSREAAAEASNGAVLASAEGALLAEIKRESEGRIQEKDREIALIQERMASLDDERKRLLASVESRIKAKEDELKDRLKAELERERQRLVDEGLSDAAIQERLREFERRKTEEFRAQLDGFAKEAEKERLALESRLDGARAEYGASLAAATAERQRIQDESRRREQELRAQLDEQGRALEAERARLAESQKGAQAELARLNEEAARVEAAQSQLSGLYAAARQALREGRLDDASRSLEALRAYLADPKTVAMPALKARRELDLFTADLLEKAIAAERAKSSADTKGAAAALDAIAAVRASTEAARAALAADRRPEAEAAYRAALTATKELSEAVAFLEGAWSSSLAARAADIEAGVKASLASLDAAAASRDEAALRAAFSRLLSSLPLGPADASRVYASIQALGGAESEAARARADTADAEAPYRAAAAAAGSSRHVDALRGFLSVLERYPSAEQSARAAAGAVSSGEALAAALDELSRRSAERVAALEAELAAARAAIGEAEARITELQNRAPAAGTAAPAAAAADPRSSAEYAALAAERDGLSEEAARLESELAASKAGYAAVTASYASYAADEDAILAKGGELALVAARSRLESFLSDPAVAAALPGMRERIARYLSSFQAAGQGEVLFNAADIVAGAARIRDAAARERYFSELATRYAGEPAMLEFLASVREGLR